MLVATATVVAMVALALSEGALGARDAALLASASACPASRSTTAAPAARRGALVCLINHARRASGLGAVRASTALARGAHRKGLDVARCGDFSHEACGSPPFVHLEPAGFPFVAAGENLFFGERPAGSARDVVAAWLASPPHRRVMLHAGFSHIGVAVIELEQFSDARGVSLWVLELARPA
jgi:uncharacterized protein YkwD